MNNAPPETVSEARAIQEEARRLREHSRQLREDSTRIREERRLATQSSDAVVEDCHQQNWQGWR